MSRGNEGATETPEVADRSGQDRSPQAIARAIEQDIIRRGWPIGTIYATQSELEERFGVSRTVLRDVTRILEQNKVLAPRRGRGGGLIVTAPDHEAVIRSVSLLLNYQKLSMAELAEVRVPLEIATVRLAAERIDEAGAHRVREVIAAETADPYGVGSGFDAPNLHVVLAEIGGNRALRLFSEVITAVGRQNAAISGARNPRQSERVIAQHVQVAAAVLAKDADLAEQRMREHIALLNELEHARTGAAPESH